MKTRTNLSVIICAHNPREDYLRRVLEALRFQTLSKEQWELLLVDNASAEPLTARYDLAWHPAGRHIRESNLGLTAARLRGILESHGEVLVFVDDDNELESTYLQRVLDVRREYPWVGAWGGEILPEFETAPPDWTRRYWGLLAIRSVPRDRWSNVPGFNNGIELCGAGLCVRREVAERYRSDVLRDPERARLDRQGTSLASGGDDDLISVAFVLGFGAGQFSGLKLKHLIPPRRLEEAYLLELVENLNVSGRILRFLHGDQWAIPHPGLTWCLRVAKYLVCRRGRDRRIYLAELRGYLKALRWRMEYTKSGMNRSKLNSESNMFVAPNSLGIVKEE